MTALRAMWVDYGDTLRWGEFTIEYTRTRGVFTLTKRGEPVGADTDLRQLQLLARAIHNRETYARDAAIRHKLRHVPKVKRVWRGGLPSLGKGR